VVIEVLSANHSRRELSDKVDDHRTIGVRECWIVSPEAHTVEVIRLSPEGMEVLDTFGTGMTIRSKVLEGCTVSVEEVFA
jgi:Uma2 family endonuclease